MTYVTKANTIELMIDDNKNLKTILLVDDDELVSLSGKILLENEGYRVIAVNTGEGAVIAADIPGIDLILMDINLGAGMDGAQAAGLILEKHDLPLIFLSSHIEPEIVEKTASITSYGYINKSSGDIVLLVSIKMAFRLFDSKKKEKEKEIALRQKTALFETLINTSIFGILVIDKDGKKILQNRKTVEILNLPEDIRDSVDFVRQLDYVKSLTLYPGKFEEKVSYLNSHPEEISADEIELKNGKVIDRYTAPVIDENGRYYGRIWTFIDITRRKLSEESIRLRESYLSAIIENQPGLLWLKDRESRFLTVNTKFAASCGMDDPELLIGKNDFDLYPKALAARYVEDDKRVIISEKPYTVEEPILDKGNITWFETFKAPIMDKQGQVIGTTGYSRDISERKRAEYELKRQLSEKELLLKEVHHRIKNNIASIESMLIMQARSLVNPEAISALQDSIGRVESMRILYEKLLLSHDYKELSVNIYLDSLIDTIREVFPGSLRINIEKQIDNFFLHSKQLFPVGIIVNELLTNALKHAFEDNNDPKILISLKKSGNLVKLTVHDNGKGLPIEFDIDNITGFGLVMVKLLCSQIGGVFNIGNYNGTRSTVEFTLP
ncbi:MAG: PAS domain-containing protein [Brevinematales bacterium]